MDIDCENLDNSICCRVLNFMADELNVKNDSITEGEYADLKDFIVDLKRINKCDFNLLVKIYAYIHGSFQGNKAVKDIYNNNFYTTRDEFFNTLIKHGVQREIALDIVKNGVWSQGQKRKEYEKILLGYELPQDVIDYFDKVNQLWTIGGCTSRVKMMYKMFENKIGR
ncbi:MAG: hypothetical protein IJA34_07605 [Lachnospiraceae bacterium]|nr:hypothetical protein [Lachnospiraceae bacterium]